jgi:hypothetical protein
MKAIKAINRFRGGLTKRQLDLLQKMRDEDEDLVYERGIGYVGLDRFGATTFRALLMACVLRHEDGEPGEFEVYTINSDGLEVLRRAGR